MKGLRSSLSVQILAALVLGAVVGWLRPSFGRSLEILATIFIRLVLVIIAPLIFSTLVVGIGGQAGLRRVGGLAIRTMLYFFAVTTLALALAFALSSLLEPGRGMSPAAAPAVELAQPPAGSFWIRLFPQSIVDSMARGDVLQIVVFSVVLAVAVSLAGEDGAPLLRWCRSLAHVMYRFTDLVMMAAPVGVFGAAAALTAREGLAVGGNFLRLIAAVYLGLGALLLVLYPLLCVLFRIPLRAFCRAVKEPFAVAFATASASGALPKAMESMEAMGVPRSVVSFTLATGLNFNPSGSTVFIGVASLFIIQAFRIQLSPADYLTLFGTLFVASKGIAGVPRSSLVVVAAALPAVGVSPEITGAGIGLLLGIDPLLDMPRTAVNTAGNCLAAALVARWEGGPDAVPASVPAGEG